MGKFDSVGNLVTAPESLKTLYLEHYRKRLEHRPIRDEYSEIFEKKVALWELRFEMLQQNKSDSWSVMNLRNTLKSLKKNKSRDPNGLINEVFSERVMGKDLEYAVLQFINGVKREFFIPHKLQMANITTIYKKKGSKNNLENDRGIFSLSVFRKIIDRLVYQENTP